MEHVVPPEFRPRLAGIWLHPIKSLDPVSVSEARIGPAGGLEHDRVWTIHPADSLPTVSLANVKARDTSAEVKLFNGKRTAGVHRIRATFSASLDEVTLAAPGKHNFASRRFAFPNDTREAAAWFSDYFERPTAIFYTREGFPDDTIANGPTVVSTATLERICEWFPEMTLDEVRRRFRTTLELDGVPAFWEDQLFGEKTAAVVTRCVRFRIGDVTFEGSNPCGRCIVPARDPCTGVEIATFQKRFSELRKAQLPTWTPVTHFDHFYRLATNTKISLSESGKLLHLGDELAPC